ncbi:MAG: hypothetical protein FWD12_13490 [Alphaproteobacteria bacterium]|nr:hypothetical protein [Alphaproteobacteria bacterium]
MLFAILVLTIPVLTISILAVSAAVTGDGEPLFLALALCRKSLGRLAILA